MNLSAVIITFNEEKNIRSCIESLHDIVDDIVVVDSFSSDNTPLICSSFPALRFFQSEWKGYASQKNYGNNLALHDWILSLDADEVLSPELRDSLKQWRVNPCAAGFNRLTSYAGKWIRYGGWYPDFKFRIFDRRQTRWEGLIHEQLIFASGNETEITRLNGDCLHYSFPDEHSHLLQTDKFSRLWAQQAFQSGRRHSQMKQIFGPVIRFVRDYFFLSGFRDGKAGFRIALISARAIACRQRYLKELIDEKRGH